MKTAMDVIITAKVLPTFNFLKAHLTLYAATGHSQSRGVSVPSKQTHSREGENGSRDTLETSSHDVDTTFLSL